MKNKRTIQRETEILFFSGISRNAWIRSLVVPGILVTIEEFLKLPENKRTKQLNKVDLPTFGRPKIAITGNPHRSSCSSTGSSRGDALPRVTTRENQARRETKLAPPLSMEEMEMETRL